jgi:hypothetical protein
MSLHSHAVVASLVCCSSIILSGTARAFDTKGHDVIEALAYRTLIEGHDGRPATPEVLRDLFNDGALVPPICFGDGSKDAACVSASVNNTLLLWPEPRSDRPDAAFRRQFSDAGQCYHFMGTPNDERSARLPDSPIPRALATTAVVRCRDLLDQLLRTIVVRGGADTRDGGQGLYELMHSVADSFSYAHTQRTGTGAIAFLRVWEPIASLAGGSLGAVYSGSPTRHAARDERDRAYVRLFGEVEGRACSDLTNVPYEVPFECLSQEGDLARQAIVELLIVVDHLRRAQLAAGASDTRPEQSDEWRAYKDKWFVPATPCRGLECEARERTDPVRSNDLVVGASASFNPTRHYYQGTLRALLLKYSWDLNPFLYGVAADVGYRRQYDDTSHYGVAALELDVFLPVGERTVVGLAPVISGYAFGSSSHSGPQLVSQALRFDTVLFRNLWLELAGPVQVDWIKPQGQWSFGVTLGFAPGPKASPTDSFMTPRGRNEEVRDEPWTPPPLWYKRVKGRKPSAYVVGSTSPYQTPSSAIPGRFYGDAVIGVAVLWNRDPWNEPYPSAYGGSLQFGLRNTQSDFRYVTGVVGTDLRWSPIRIFALSLEPVRVEAGVQVSGTGVDSAPDVHSWGGHQYYLLVGSRLGVAFNAGLVDLLVQAPTLAWHSNPFNGQEILTFQVGIRL